MVQTRGQVVAGYCQRGRCWRLREDGLVEVKVGELLRLELWRTNKERQILLERLISTRQLQPPGDLLGLQLELLHHQNKVILQLLPLTNRHHLLSHRRSKPVVGLNLRQHLHHKPLPHNPIILKKRLLLVDSAQVIASGDDLHQTIQEKRPADIVIAHGDAVLFSEVYCQFFP